MALTVEQIRIAALDLQPADRQALAQDLLLSIDGASAQELDQAWLSEARRRDASFRAGKTGAKSVDEVLTRLRGKANS